MIKKKLITILILLMTLGGLILVKATLESKKIKTPEIDGYGLGTFSYIAKLGQQEIEGFSAACASKEGIYIYNKGKLFLIDGRGKLKDEIDLGKEVFKENVPYISSLNVNNSGEVYLSEIDNGKIYKIFRKGSAIKSEIINVKAQRPVAICTDKRGIFVFDAADSRLKFFSFGEKIEWERELVYKNLRTNFVNAIKKSERKNLLILSDSNNGRVLLFDLKSKRVIKQIKGFTHPRGIDLIDDEKIVVADTFGSFVSLVDIEKGSVVKLEVPEKILEEGLFPFAVAYDRQSRTIVATDRLVSRIYIWSGQ